MQSAEEQTADAVFKAAYPCPEFQAVENVKYLGIETSATGKTWAFVQYPRNFMHSVYSARPNIKEKSIEIALRMKWGDESLKPPAGDLRIVESWDFEKQEGFWPKLILDGPPTDGTWIAGIELPFRPDQITIVAQ